MIDSWFFDTPFVFYLSGIQVDLLKIGYIRNTHGLKGELKIDLLTDDADRFKKINVVVVKISDEYINLNIQYIKINAKNAIIKFASYDDINQAVILKSKYMYIDKTDAVKLNDGEYYTQDLIDCDVYYNEKKIGSILQVDNFGSCDIIVIKCGNEVINYPFIKHYIDKVDINNKMIIINQTEGFF